MLFTCTGLGNVHAISVMPVCISRCSTVLRYTHAVCAWKPILRSKHSEIHAIIHQHHAQINFNTALFDLKAGKRQQIMYSPVHSMHRTMLLEAKQKKELGLTKVAVYKAPDQTDYSERGTYDMSVDEEDLKKRLSPMQYHVTQEHGTERAFSGEYCKVKADGFYHCVVCDAVLFKSDTKYDSGSGWPSFYDLAEKGVVKLHRDSSNGMVRTECVCAKCGAHLGHVFSDGPDPTGKRYCINSASLKFHPKKKLDKSDL